MKQNVSRGDKEIYEQDRQCNIEVRSYNQCCSGKAIIIIYSECVFVALVIQHAMHMHHVVICGLPRSTIFFRIICLGKKKVVEYKTCFDLLYTFYLKYFSF